MAASALRMEEPAAPITATNRYQRKISRHVQGKRQLTVVAQGNKLDIKDAAVVLSDPTNADSVSLAEITVKTGLGPVGLVKDLDRGLGGRGASQILSIRNVAAQGVFDLLGRRGRALGETQRDAGGVAVQDRNTVAGCRHPELLLVLERSGVGIERTQDLLGLGLQLVLLTRNEGHDVVNDVHAADTGVSSTRDSLHGNDGYVIDLSETRLEGGKGGDEADDGAVAVAYQEALVEAEDLALVGDQVEMVEVDGRDDEGHERVASVVLCVGEDGNVGVLELLLDIAGDIAVEAAEDNVAVGKLAGLALADD